MCGYCKGYYTTCDVCSETIDLIGKIRSEECFKCQICDGGTVCIQCTNNNIIYCSCCVLDDNLLEESIEKLKNWSFINSSIRNYKLKRNIQTRLYIGTLRRHL